MDNYWDMLMDNDYMMKQAIARIKGVDPICPTLEEQMDIQQTLLNIKAFKLANEQGQGKPNRNKVDD